MATHYIQEILCPEEFAQRIGIGKSTVHEWIKAGYLVKGIHYAQVRSVIRFPWPWVFFQLLNDSGDGKIPPLFPRIEFPDPIEVSDGSEDSDSPQEKLNLRRENFEPPPQKPESSHQQRQKPEKQKPKRESVINLEYS